MCAASSVDWHRLLEKVSVVVVFDSPFAEKYMSIVLAMKAGEGPDTQGEAVISHQLLSARTSLSLFQQQWVRRGEFTVDRTEC